MNVKKMILVALISSGSVTFAQASNVTAADSTGITELCMAAITGNRAQMYNKIKSLGYSRQYLAKNVQCDGENIIKFIHRYGTRSDEMARTLERNTTKVSIRDL